VVVAAVTTTFQEADIIGTTVAHLQAEGVERIYAADASADGTREIMRDLGVTVIVDNDPFHYQPKWTEVLAELARQDGADWVIPFDADEFWYATDGRTIPEALTDVPPEIIGVNARMWEHNDWDNRQPSPKPLPKVAVRAVEGMRFAEGNHACFLPGDYRWEILDLREIQFRGFDHMCRKSRERTDRLDPSLGAGFGAHQRGIHQMDLDAKRVAFEALLTRTVVHDPIPSRLDHHPDFKQV
jgi:hypothetical protein